MAWLVLDEADRLLVEEGLEHVRRICGELGPQTRFAFVSATEGPATTRIARGLAPDLAFVRAQSGISPAIRHCYLVCEERDKIDWLRKALRGLEPSRALVFVHRGASAERIRERLDYHQLAVADLHGARDKFARQEALDSFRRGRARVLIASDIAARGLDIAEVELVVNVDVPSQGRDYLHRAGRTGRAGAAGLVLSLMTAAETRLARRYAEELGIAMECVRMVRGDLVPSDEEARPPHAHRKPAAGGDTSPRKPRTASAERGKAHPAAPGQRQRVGKSPQGGSPGAVRPPEDSAKKARPETGPDKRRPAPGKPDAKPPRPPKPKGTSRGRQPKPKTA